MLLDKTQKGLTMNSTLIRKAYVKLLEDYHRKNSLYTEEICFLPIGSEGFIIDEHTINLALYNTSDTSDALDTKRQELIRRDIQAKENGCHLVLINGRVLSIPSDKLDYTGREPCSVFQNNEEAKAFSKHLKSIKVES